jgi:hypothetical protein
MGGLFGGAGGRHHYHHHTVRREAPACPMSVCTIFAIIPATGLFR